MNTTDNKQGASKTWMGFWDVRQSILRAVNERGYLRRLEVWSRTANQMSSCGDSDFECSLWKILEIITKSCFLKEITIEESTNTECRERFETGYRIIIFTIEDPFKIGHTYELYLPEEYCE